MYYNMVHSISAETKHGILDWWLSRLKFTTEVLLIEGNFQKNILIDAFRVQVDARFLFAHLQAVYKFVKKLHLSLYIF